MAINIIPGGYTAQIIASGTTIEELTSIVTPLESSIQDGTLMIVEMQYSDYPTAEQISDLNQFLLGAGITPWAGKPLVYVDGESPTVCVACVKTSGFMGFIGGGFLALIGIILIGGIVYMLLPESVKSVIEMMITLSIVVIMMKIMTPMMKGTQPEEPQPKETK